LREIQLVAVTLGTQEAKQTSVNKPEGRVIRFQRPGSLPVRPLPHQSPVKDLGKYESDAGPDDYRHRMMMNIAGLAVTIFLVLVGIWIANTMAQMRKNQDCVLSGRRGCTPVEVPIQPR
jgi:hypothetical protein